MQIQEIKTKLSLEEILQHYNLPIDKNKMLLCPFHEDKTASLQVNLQKNLYKCHACGKKGDVIQFVQDYENLNKHEALVKCTSLIDNGKLKIENSEPTTINHQPTTFFLQKMFNYFKNSIPNSKPAQEYLQTRNLDYKKLEVGYNAGQFHHGTRKDEELIKNCLEIGLLLDKGQTAKTGDKAYSVFGKWCICFALKNKENQIVSLYFRSTLNDKESKHFYLKNRQGIYPNYPNPKTKKLILTESIIDAASLLQIKNIAENYSLIACFGTNGLNEEILKAIKDLKQLEEIIFAFDNDTAGKEAINKYANLLLEEVPGIKISVLESINKDINETLQLHSEEIFIEILDKRSDFIFSNEKVSQRIEPSTGTGNAIDFLKRLHLIENLNKEIGKAGIVGEENSRMLLFLIIISYLNKNPLHALVQGSSGSGKTHIISRIADLMPQEDVLRFTRITESSLYNWGEFDLFQKIIIIEDLDGLKEDALYALREFISNQVLRSSVTIKDKKGNNKSAHKIVKGQFSSLSATTKGETYEDNMSRSFLIAVDESKEQTAKIIDYQNKRNAGAIDPNQNEKAINFIQQIIRNLKVYEVINPYATQLLLPEKVHKIRRLNEMYQAVIKQVTFLNQYQRKLTNNNQLITEIEDIEQATEILFESIVLKVDELDGSLRQFFERLKKYVKNDSQEFILREIRQELNISKTQIFRYIQTLLELEYIKQVGGFANKGIKYKISYWDNYQKLRAEIKDFLMLQIEELKNKKIQ
jgi:DNA primase